MSSLPLTRRRSLATIAALGSAALSPVHAAGAPLRVGLVPFMSPTVLLNAFRAVREHLERSLDRPVEMLTAKDFRSLVEATARNEYDMVLLPAHVARLAMVDWRYEPVAGTVDALQVQVLVKGNGPVKSAADLKGQSAGMLDALSLTASVGIKWLQDQGLAGDVKVQPLPSINSAMFALERDEVAMVVAGGTQLAMLPASTPRNERVLATIRDIPGPIYVARPGLPADELARLRAAMTTFRPDAAQPVTASNSVLRPVSAAELVALDPFVAIARKALAAAR
jgi:phosphonate transport system substrate-binding protein